MLDLNHSICRLAISKFYADKRTTLIDRLVAQLNDSPKISNEALSYKIDKVLDLQNLNFKLERRLSSFYNQLNEQFIKFFEKLPFWEGLNSDNEPLNQEQKDFFRKQIQKLPEEAVIVYRKQYFTLANTFPDFFIWSNQKEHRWLERQIDVGFCHMAELLRQNHSFAEQAKNDATDTMERYRVKYANYLQGPIIDHSAGFDTDGDRKSVV